MLPMDRFDVLAGIGVLAMIVGLLLVHPGLALAALGYVTVSGSNRRAG